VGCGGVFGGEPEGAVITEVSRRYTRLVPLCVHGLLWCEGGSGEKGAQDNIGPGSGLTFACMQRRRGARFCQDSLHMKSL
jgi:hypothetical protein